MVKFILNIQSSHRSVMGMALETLTLACWCEPPPTNCSFACNLLAKCQSWLLISTTTNQPWKFHGKKNRSWIDSRLSRSVLGTKHGNWRPATQSPLELLTKQIPSKIMVFSKRLFISCQLLLRNFVFFRKPWNVPCFSNGCFYIYSHSWRI